MFSRSSSSLARGARLPPSPSCPRRSFSLAQLVLRVRHVQCASYASFLRALDSPSLSATSIGSSVSPLNATSNLSLPPSRSDSRASRSSRAPQRGSAVSFYFLKFPFPSSVPLHLIRQAPGDALRLAEAAFLGAHRAQLMLRVRCANDLFPFPFSTPFHCESSPSRSLGPHRPRSAIYRLVLRVPFRYRPRLPSSFTACPSLMQRAQLVLRVRHIEHSFSPFVSSLRLPVVGDSFSTNELPSSHRPPPARSNQSSSSPHVSRIRSSF